MTLDSEFDALISETSALDIICSGARFPDSWAKSLSPMQCSVRELIARVSETVAVSKDELPLIKLAEFGHLRTEADCLRHDGNLIAISGIIADYDGEAVSIADAAERARAAGIAVGFYSSPRHTPDRPRWRAIAPLSGASEVAEHDHLTARLNGALGGILATESFTKSQSYYYGRVADGCPIETAVVEGRALDLAPELEAGALGRDGKPFRPASAINRAESDEPFDRDKVASALAAITSVDERNECWRPIGMALHAATAGSDEGRQLWDDWSAQSAKFKIRDQKRAWNKFKLDGENRIGIGTLFKIATDHGWTPDTRADEFDDLDDFDPMPADGAAAKRSRLRFFSPTECAAGPTRGYIVKGLVAPGDIGCIYGAPGAGKSLISPHIGYAVARGVTAFGMRTKPGTVF